MHAGPGHPAWPEGKRFAFTVFDDTDTMTLETGPPVYDLLTDLGFRITKSVWPVAPAGPPRTGGATCADPDYLAWVLELRDAGHEIGFHNASDHPSKREETIAALDTFRDLFGHDPRIGADHSGNIEAMYWGPKRLTGIRSWAYRQGTALTRPGAGVAQGDDTTSPYFWGDVLRDRIEYWRNFTYTELDVLRSCPAVPYHDPVRPYVNWWYASTHAPTLVPFLDLLDPQKLDALEEAGGACIVYTHFGVDFAKDGTVDPRFARGMEALAARDGWFAPASEVLDHIRAERHSEEPLTDRQRARMENRWVFDHVRTRAVKEVRKAVKRRRQR
ncbi:MAG TPA: hypothetical protein VNS19_11595 [Acidimicrobiales bacterium]|nr:hypothetical protein [Acidimicrobiales bacterium]